MAGIISETPGTKGMIISKRGFAKGAISETKRRDNIVLVEGIEQIKEKYEQIIQIRRTTITRKRSTTIKEAERLEMDNLSVKNPKSIRIDEEENLQIKELRKKKKRFFFHKEEINKIEEIPDGRTNNKFHVQVEIEGQQDIALFDTGATQHMMELQKAEELKIEWTTEGRKRFGTAGGYTKSLGTAIVKRTVGPERKIRKNLKFHIFNQPSMTPIIIGRNFMEEIGP